jgi:ABC-type multidrug transport system fused ATPase/permease subunit
MEVGMENRQSKLAKVLSLVVMVALPLMAFSSPALAQKAQELKDAHKMMADGWKMFNDGQQQVIQGKEMNDLVATQMGFQDKMAPGNKFIQDGRNTITQGATLFAQGDKTFTDNLTSPGVAKQGLKMMSDGFNIAMGGMKMMGEGMRMNNQVAEAAGAIEKFSQGNQVMETGMTTMAQGAQLFRQGENLFLKLK